VKIPLQGSSGGLEGATKKEITEEAVQDIEE
jgi:hypothetical protein